MTNGAPAPQFHPPGYRTRLTLALALGWILATVVVLVIAGRSLADATARELYATFQGELAGWQAAQSIRHAVLVERCRMLARRPRLHAALEDNALDLLYPTAADELRDLLVGERDPARGASVLQAEFYRFLDPTGAVIAPGPGGTAGDAEQMLALRGLPGAQHLGYVEWPGKDGSPALREVIATPVVSTETGNPIATLVLGFLPFGLDGQSRHAGMVRGIWLGGKWHAGVGSPAGFAMDAQLAGRLAGPEGSGASGIRAETGGLEYLTFAKLLNPGSAYPPAVEIHAYPLSPLHASVRRLQLQIGAIGVLILLAGIGISRLIAGGLAAPVERLAIDSEANAAGRRRAEVALQETSVELQRAARFSADASHQLMTPLTVLRAGLEEMQSREHVSPAEREEISGLIRQTCRLSSVIKHLLLLSRMDAGRLRIELLPVDLTQLVEAALDDLSALPETAGLDVAADVPAGIRVAGDKGYLALILQNLLDNARKYNRPGGRIRVTARREGEFVRLVVGNTGAGIPEPAREFIFERFHRGAVGENVPGYGLGLNLARELARLHQGDLVLLGSSPEKTEFEVSFRLAPGEAETDGGSA